MERNRVSKLRRKMMMRKLLQLLFDAFTAHLERIERANARTGSLILDAIDALGERVDENYNKIENLDRKVFVIMEKAARRTREGGRRRKKVRTQRKHQIIETRKTNQKRRLLTELTPKCIWEKRSGVVKRSRSFYAVLNVANTFPHRFVRSSLLLL